MNKMIYFLLSLFIFPSLALASAGNLEAENEAPQAGRKGKGKATIDASLSQKSFAQEDLNAEFTKKMEEALNSPTPNLEFLFSSAGRSRLQQSLKVHAKNLKILKDVSFFERFDEFLNNPGFSLEAVERALGVSTLVELNQKEGSSKKHYIFVHEKTGLLFRYKEEEMQYSLSFYLPKHQDKLIKRKDKAGLDHLLHDTKQDAEAFKLFITKHRDGRILALPVPHSPSMAAGIKEFVQDLVGYSIKDSHIGTLEKHLKNNLICKLGHPVHLAPTYFSQLQAQHGAKFKQPQPKTPSRSNNGYSSSQYSRSKSSVSSSEGSEGTPSPAKRSPSKQGSPLANLTNSPTKSPSKGNVLTSARVSRNLFAGLTVGDDD